MGAVAWMEAMPDMRGKSHRRVWHRRQSSASEDEADQDGHKQNMTKTAGLRQHSVCMQRSIE